MNASTHKVLSDHLAKLRAESAYLRKLNESERFVERAAIREGAAVKNDADAAEIAADLDAACVLAAVVARCPPPIEQLANVARELLGAVDALTSASDLLPGTTSRRLREAANAVRDSLPA